MITMEMIILIFNIFTFLLFGLDKLNAKKKSFRIPEFVLIVLALFFGGAGAMLGMVVFNHKTSKMLFRIMVPLSVLINYVFYSDSFRFLRQTLIYLVKIIPE